MSRERPTETYRCLACGEIFIDPHGDLPHDATPTNVECPRCGEEARITVAATIVAYRKESDGTIRQTMLFGDYSVAMFKTLARMFRQTTVLYLVRCRAKAPEPRHE